MGVVTKGNLDRLTGITGHDKTGGPPVALVISTAEASDFFADEAFAMAGCALLRAHTLSDAEELCKSRNPDLLVLPLRLEGVSLIPYLTECKAEKDLSVIVVAESGRLPVPPLFQCPPDAHPARGVAAARRRRVRTGRPARPGR